MVDVGTMSLHRGRANLVDLAGAYKVVIDRTVVSSILTRESKAFDVPPGRHFLHLGFLGLQSKEIEVLVSPGEEECFTCRTAWYGWPVLTPA